MNELIEQFVIESRELVQQATDDLLVLEKTPADRERLDSAFRAFHTLKGGAGIVGFPAMERAVHAAENLLAAARSGLQPIAPALVDLCLQCLDQVVQWLDTTQGAGDFPANAEDGARRLVDRFAGSFIPVVPPRGGAGPDNAGWADELLARYPAVRAQSVTAVRYAPDRDCFFHGEDPVAQMAALPGLLALRLEPAAPWPALHDLDPFACNLVLSALTQTGVAEVAQALGDARDLSDIEALTSVVSGPAALAQADRALLVLEAQIELLSETQPQGRAGRIAAAGMVAFNLCRHMGRMADADTVADACSRSTADSSPRALQEAIEALLKDMSQKGDPMLRAPQGQTIRLLRVDAARIDTLVNLTGELTVAKNAIGHAAKLAREQGSGLAAMLRERHGVLDRLVGELQQSVLGMRVLPLRHVFQRFPRLVREIAADLGKPAILIVEGDDTEADKVIVEMLFEPLLHVLRNAMAHGVEPAPVRAAKGKAPVATIRLRARREGELVVVEVSDDGGGIDVARIRLVAAERAMAPVEVLESMSDAEAINLIFMPGFSTAADVTDLSGRGVGMDAVRTAVQRLGGKVEVGSRLHEGTSVRFVLPFSVMMTRIMTVGAGGQMYGIPLDTIVETVRIRTESIVPVGAANAIVLRNQTLPLLELAVALGVPRDETHRHETTVVVASIDGQLGALQVDRLGERMEVMLRPMDGLLSGLPAIAGSTLLGDGSVLLVLDMGVLLQ